MSLRCSTMVSVAAGAFVAALGACAPLPPEPELRGPHDERAALTAGAPTQELVWARGGHTLRITRASRVCQESASSSGCTLLSKGDRSELDRFFGTETFRRRWDAFVPCAPAANANRRLLRHVLGWAEGWQGPRPSGGAPPCPDAIRRCARSSSGSPTTWSSATSDAPSPRRKAAGAGTEIRA